MMPQLSVDMINNNHTDVAKNYWYIMAHQHNLSICVVMSRHLFAHVI